MALSSPTVPPAHSFLGTCLNPVCADDLAAIPTGTNPLLGIERLLQLGTVYGSRDVLQVQSARRPVRYHSSLSVRPVLSPMLFACTCVLVHVLACMRELEARWHLCT